MNTTVKKYLFLAPILLLGLSCGKKSEQEPKKVSPTQAVSVQETSTTPPPLKQGLAALEYSYGEGMKLKESASINSGIFAGHLKNIYKGKGTQPLGDEVIAKDGAVYRRTLNIPKSVFAEAGDDYYFVFFTGLLYEAAFGVKPPLDPMPQEVIDAGMSFKLDCARSCAGPGMYYYVYKGYAFGCINEHNKTVKFDVVSEEVYKAEKLARLKGGE